ncbi:hypothetical protein TPHA_0O00870 [Tetrapisispora phaffii CBS 4417]|uniref:GTP-binding protein n=1 Tax=Tetrapisispora phaffii (strain ATCC 24235 / CBS 4417 / NBRC 1672 / NRRL Y-8282 / UCD 70-5) TaxID=1071381 RepID=G8C1M8_TETPH|nr:hypothetical protein TPHA_0O00870 [Tetrapisispora phaffii CBS 4417]CCE66056.1 hypothetical protein TPHA_0O00870 [Tetrapisispora phaffii CBS 4417]
MESDSLMFGGTHSIQDAPKGLQFKICIFGGKAVGKTSLCVQYVESHFVESHYPTNVQNEFTKMLKYNNQDYTLEIIDTAGQDETSMINSKCLNGCKGIILCYSVNNRHSFDLIKIIWEKLVDQLENINDIPVIVVANKIDSRDTSECKLDRNSIVKKSEGEQLTKYISNSLMSIKQQRNGNKNGHIDNSNNSPVQHIANLPKVGFIEVSTKLNINVDESILILLKEMEYLAANGPLGDDAKCTVM